MASYGVATANAFDLLSEDPQHSSQSKVKKEKDDTKDKKDKKTQKTVSRENNGNSTIGVPVKENRPPNARSRGVRGGRGQTVRRGGRGAPAPREGKRIYERKSGTGRGREVRKGGYGGTGAVGTWEEEANVAQETLQAESDAQNQAKSDSLSPSAPTAAASDNKAQEPLPETERQKQQREEDEEEAKKQSFDQWLAEKRKRAVEADSQLNTREVEVDEKQFNPSKVLSKSNEVTEYPSLKKESKAKKGKGKAKKYFIIGRIQRKSGR